MVDLRNVRSLSDFQRNARKHIKRLKKTGKPEILTVNGEARLVVQDAASYQNLLDKLERLSAVDAIREGLRQVERGQEITLEQFDARMRKKFKIPRAYDSQDSLNRIGRHRRRASVPLDRSKLAG